MGRSILPVSWVHIAEIGSSESFQWLRSWAVYSHSLAHAAPLNLSLSPAVSTSRPVSLLNATSQLIAPAAMRRVRTARQFGVVQFLQDVRNSCRQDVVLPNSVWRVGTPLLASRWQGRVAKEAEDRRDGERPSEQDFSRVVVEVRPLRVVILGRRISLSVAIAAATQSASISDGLVIKSCLRADRHEPAFR